MRKEDESQVEHFNCAVDDEDATLGPKSGPILLPDVIRPLCKFLGLKDIKACRLVCHSWNYGATPVLKARTQIKIPFYPEGVINHKNYDEAYKEEEKRWTGIVERLKFCPVKVFLIKWRNVKDEHIHPPLDFRIFPLVQNLKFIRVSLSKATPWQNELCEKIILAASTTLEKLKFDWDHDQELPSFSTTIFPKLKKLVLDSQFEQTGNKSAERIGQAVTESFPGLEHLKMNCKDLDKISKMQPMPMFPLSLSSFIFTGELDPKDMECLLRFPVTLKKLGIDIVFETDNHSVDELPTILYKLLKKHSPTLEKLSIDICLPNYDEQLKWKFPVFPALKRLRICNYSELHNLEFETGSGSGNFGEIDYTVCFPVLESLYFSIESNNLGNVVPFIPPEQNDSWPEVESVIKFEVHMHILHGGETSDDKLARARLYMLVLEIFPNARDSVVKKLRKALLL